MRRLISKGVNLNIKALRYGLRQAMRLERRLNDSFDQAAHNKAVVQSTCRYDMFSAADEGYYQNQYWHWIEKFLTQEKVNPHGCFLDAGCGHGRMSIPLAKWCGVHGKVTGIDLSEPAIEQAKQYAHEEQVSVEFFATDLLIFLQKTETDSFDGVLLLEIVFFLPNYKAILKEITRVLKPGGFFIGSFRSQYFNLLHSMRNGLWDSTDMILGQRTGALVGGAVQFNWHTLPELRSTLQELAFDICHVVGIGSCSGIPGDPHDFVRPSVLSKQEKMSLMKSEKTIGELLPETGRYILISSKLKKI